MRTVSLSLAMLVAVSLACGCENLRKSPQEARLPVEQAAIIHDIPIPAGFKIDLDRSFHSQSGEIRSGFQTYRGQGTAPVLLEFFRDNMPIAGWALIRETSGSGSYALQFEKRSEQVEVKISPGRFSSAVLISFFPKGSPRK